MRLSWTWKPFAELTLDELYAIMAMRQEVFIVEQDCPYLDADGKDIHSFHLMGSDGDGLVAYARIVGPGISYEEVSIGRIVSSPKLRGQGFGKKLMEEAVSRIEKEYGHVAVRISAQSHLGKFYREFGFSSTGKEYPEDGIPHIEMLRSRPKLIP